MRAVVNETTGRPPLTGKLILLVDDESVASPCEAILHRAGAELVLASNAYQAVLALSAGRDQMQRFSMRSTSDRRRFSVFAHVSIYMPFVLVTTSDDGSPLTSPLRKSVDPCETVGALWRMLAADVR